MTTTREAGRIGGQSKSADKLAAVRENLKKARAVRHKQNKFLSHTIPVLRSQGMGGGSKGNHTKSVRKNRKAGTR